MRRSTRSSSRAVVALLFALVMIESPPLGTNILPASATIQIIKDQNSGVATAIDLDHFGQTDPIGRPKGCTAAAVRDVERVAKPNGRL